MEMIDEGWQGDKVYRYQNDQFQEILVRADSMSSAYEVVLDHLPTVEDTGDINEAYGIFDRFADFLKERNPEGTYEGGSKDWIRVCEFIRRWEGDFAKMLFEGMDPPDLVEGYQYTPNGNITFAGHHEILEVASEREASHFYEQCGIEEEDR